MLNVSDVKDKAKCVTGNTVPDCEILKHSSWHVNHVADTKQLLNEWLNELVVMVVVVAAAAAAVEVVSSHFANFLLHFSPPSEFET